MPAPLLATEGLSAGYGTLRVLSGLDVEIHDREIVALVGPNGAGKSTLLRALSGLIPKSGGTVRFAGQDISAFSARECGRAGLVHVIEGHRIFPSLTVEENLLLAGLDQAAAERQERVGEAFDVFPEIAEKRALRAGTLSGGQQQMLVVAQGMVRRPKLLMLDEPSAGLAPVLIDRVLEVVSMLRAKGTAVLLVEQAVEKALRVADRAYVLVHGQIVLNTTAAEARKPGILEHAYLGTA
jgi:branched-chain amino acid transport system ATP-binding protein